MSNIILARITSPSGHLLGRVQNLQALNYSGLEEWEEAKNIFSQMDSSKVGKNRKAAIVEDVLSTKRKKPFLAGALSIAVPGLGYVYTGHPQTALSAFLINGLLAYATYTSIRTENYGMAVLTGAFNLSFYLGNISGSSKSANRKNELSKMKAIQELETLSNL